jgi:hypothetical protein
MLEYFTEKDLGSQWMTCFFVTILMMLILIPTTHLEFGTSSINVSVDSKSVQESIQNFFHDLQQLLQMGSIRTFQSEKECAFIIDDTSRNGYGILNQSNVMNVRQRLEMTSNCSSTQKKYSMKSKTTTMGSKPAIHHRRRL